MESTATSATDRLTSGAVWLVALGGAIAAWVMRFVQDDAFISMRYARNLIAGKGLLFNSGEPPVEGYTNFLWTLLLAVPEALAIDPVSFAYGLAPLFAAGTILLTYVLAKRLGASAAYALGASVLVASHSVFLFWCSGGLETGLVALLVIACAGTACVEPRSRTLLSLSICAALAVMTRPDALLLAGPACAVAFARVVQGDRPVRRLASLLAPGLALAGAWAAFKIGYYGHLLPNTFAAKTGAAGAWSLGLHYLATFAASTWLAVLPVTWIVFAFRWMRDANARGKNLPIVVAPVLIFATYVASVGGDFMEFRLMAPTIPLMLAGTAALLRRSSAPGWVTAAVAIVVLGGSIHHGVRFEHSARGIEGTRQLAAHLDAPYQDWGGIGRRLGELFEGEDVRIAVSPAGAIPYYSQLPTLDMLGLNDAWVARNGVAISGQPGHARAAPFDYLVEQRVHLVIGHPWVTGPDSPAERLPRTLGLGGFGYLFDVEIDRIRQASMIAIPLGDGRHVVTLYLTRHPAVDRAIAEGRWPTFDLSQVR